MVAVFERLFRDKGMWPQQPIAVAVIESAKRDERAVKQFAQRTQQSIVAIRLDACSGHRAAAVAALCHCCTTVPLRALRVRHERYP
jgi:hypothetical protein